MSVNGNFYGVRTEREDPVVYDPDMAMASRLKAGLNRLTGEAGKGRVVRLMSRVPEYNGTFLVAQGRLEKGKYGQVHLWLAPEGSDALSVDLTGCLELWSYRHSGIISEFEVIPN